MKTPLIIAMCMLLCHEVYAQEIFKEIRKYDMIGLENKIINRAKKQLHLDKNKSLQAVPVFLIEVINDFTEDSISVSGFLNNIKLISNKRIDFYVYDESSTLITHTSNLDKNIYLNYGNPKDKDGYRGCLLYLKKIKPDCIFDLFFNDIGSPCFFYYKGGMINNVYFDWKKRIVIDKPLSEIRNLKSYNPFRFSKYPPMPVGYDFGS